MNDRLSRLVAGWLSHPTGVLQAVATTAVWFSIPEAFGWKLQVAIFWYLAYCTFISYATQFTLSYQNAKADRVLGQTLRNQMDTMKLLLALAERDVATGEQLAAKVAVMEAVVGRMLEVTEEARAIHLDNAKLIGKLSRRSRSIIEAALDAAEPDR